MLRCPECAVEIDVDEDEVEEGEILSCPECETELEVSQTHPVALKPIADDLDEEETRTMRIEEEDKTTRTSTTTATSRMTKRKTKKRTTSRGTA